MPNRKYVMRQGEKKQIRALIQQLTFVIILKTIKKAAEKRNNMVIFTNKRSSYGYITYKS